jgi:coenzyme F420-dependent glucose-6-phosphate dehydrogenase
MKLALGYYSDLNQRTPRQALEYAVMAEKEGFDSVCTCDHFHPWVHTGASGGFAWVWLGSLGERTNRVMMGTGLTAPTIRYNPAIVAQAFATLSDLYPSRVFIALGTGEAMNELPLGFDWPSHRERAQRLEEAIKIMRLLWTKEFVDFKGHYYRLSKANLYTKPPTSIPIYVAANGPKVAELAGRLGDGFLTLPFPDSHYKDVLFPAVDRGANLKLGHTYTQVENASTVSHQRRRDRNSFFTSSTLTSPTGSNVIASTLSRPVSLNNGSRVHTNPSA